MSDESPSSEDEGERRVRLHDELVTTAAAIQLEMGPYVTYLTQGDPSTLPPDGFKASWPAAYAAIKAALADPKASQITRTDAATEQHLITIATDAKPVGACRTCSRNMRLNPSGTFAAVGVLSNFQIGCALRADWEVGFDACHPDRLNLSQILVPCGL